MSSDRNRSVGVVGILLGGVAIALAAGIYADRSGGDGGAGVISTGGGTSQDPAGLPPGLVETLVVATLVIGALILLVAAGLAVWFRGRDGLVMIARFVGQMALVAALVGVLFFGAKLLLVLFSTGTVEAPGPGGASPVGVNASDGNSAIPGGDGTAPTLVGFLSMLLVAGVLLYITFQQDEDDAIGAAAGGGGATPPAVDGDDDAGGPQIVIDDVSQSNAVYSAWHEMATRALDASERTATPSEVAGAAVRSGLDRDAVRTLTSLFEEVRYGDRPVTDERERKASAALDALDSGRGAGS